MNMPQGESLKEAVSGWHNPDARLRALRAIEAGKVRWLMSKNWYRVLKGADASTRWVDWACAWGYAGHVEYGRGYRVELTTLGHQVLPLLLERVEEGQ